MTSLFDSLTEILRQVHPMIPMEEIFYIWQCRPCPTGNKICLAQAQKATIQLVGQEDYKEIFKTTTSARMNKVSGFLGKAAVIGSGNTYFPLVGHAGGVIILNRL